MFRMVSLVAFGLAFIALASATYPLWRLESEKGRICPMCSGPLGAEKSGIKGQGLSNLHAVPQAGERAFYR